MHAINIDIRAPGTLAPARRQEAVSLSGEEEPVAREAASSDGSHAPDEVQSDWLARPELLRRRGRRAARQDADPDAGIRLRRARRVFAPFSALPSLARPSLDLRSRRR